MINRAYCQHSFVLEEISTCKGMDFYLLKKQFYSFLVNTAGIAIVPDS